jgi:hypothetical protein
MHRRGHHLVYSTSRFADSRLVSAELMRVPAAEVHAKEMGTTLAVCGENTLSWFKFLDLPFHTIASDRCPRCVKILTVRGSAEKDNC